MGKPDAQVMTCLVAEPSPGTHPSVVTVTNDAPCSQPANQPSSLPTRSKGRLLAMRINNDMDRKCHFRHLEARHSEIKT